MAIIYLGKQKTMPVWVGVRPAFYDEQGQIPYGWCVSCGMECYDQGMELCPECERMRKNGEEYAIPLQ